MYFENLSEYPARLPDRRQWRGDDWIRPVTFSRKGERVDLVAEGWTGWKAQYRNTNAPDDVQDIEIDVSEASDGLLTLKLTGAQTRVMRNGSWDLQSVNIPAGVLDGRTWLVQSFLMAGDITATT